MDLTDDATATFIDTDAGSTAELVAELVDAGLWRCRPDVAFPLLAGPLDDTGFLETASAEMIERAIWLLARIDGHEPDLVALFDCDPTPSADHAVTIEVLRATGYRTGDVTLAVSRAGAHESGVCRALLEAGVDCAFVCSSQAEGVRVVGRAMDAFASRVSLGASLLPALAERFGGDGGGHAGAGAAILPISVADAHDGLLDCLEAQSGLTFAPVSW